LGLFQWLKQLFPQNSYGTQQTPGSLFTRLDVNKIKADLGIEQLGGEHGLKNLPSANSATFSKTEKQIILPFENNFKSSYRISEGELTSYKGRLVSLALGDIRQRLDNLDASIRGHYAQKIAEGKNSISICKKRITDAFKELEQFKTKNKLERPAHYPVSRFFRWSIIIFMVAIESFLNGTFLEKGHELGYSGAVGLALVISVFNIGSGLGTGWFFTRLLNHRTIPLKLIGALVTGIYLPFTVIFNFGLAHYRMAFIKNPDPTLAEIIKNVLALRLTPLSRPQN
jgi:hypothetical protein